MIFTPLQNAILRILMLKKSKYPKSLFYLAAFSIETVFLGFVFFENNIGAIERYIMIFLLILVYICSFFQIKKAGISKQLLFTIVSILIATLIITPIRYHSDIANYIAGARLAFVHHLNPYTTTFTKVPSDHFYKLIADNPWLNSRYTYGPLFIYISGVLTFISANNFGFNFLLFKILFGLTIFVSSLVIYMITKDKVSTLLFAFNPIILVSLIKEGHTEAILVLLLLVSLYLLKRGATRKYKLLGWLAVTSSALIKPTFLIFLPFYFVYVTNNKSNTYKVKFIIAAIILTLLFSLQFWSGPETFERFIGLLSNVTSYKITHSIQNTVVLNLLEYAKIAKPFLVSNLLTKSAFLLLYIYLFANFVRRRKVNDLEKLINSLSVSYILFILLFLTWFFYWYAAPVITLLSANYGLSKDKKKYYISIFIITTLSIFYTYTFTNAM